MSHDHFYDVTMTVEVTRRVLAKNPNEAVEKAPTDDMIHEIKHYGLDYTLGAKIVTGVLPDDTDKIDEIGAEIVRDANARKMHLLKEEYDRIRRINNRRQKAGLDEYMPTAFDQLTDDFLTALKSED